MYVADASVTFKGVRIGRIFNQSVGEGVSQEAGDKTMFQNALALFGQHVRAWLGYGPLCDVLHVLDLSGFASSFATQPHSSLILHS